VSLNFRHACQFVAMTAMTFAGIFFSREAYTGTHIWSFVCDDRLGVKSYNPCFAVHMAIRRKCFKEIAIDQITVGVLPPDRLNDCECLGQLAP
jgi:hypothetical protein